MKFHKNKKSGFIIIEVLLSLVIFSVLFLTIFSTISFLERRTTRSRYDSQAAGFVQDGMEIAHNALIAQWDEYVDGEYSPIYNATTRQYTLETGPETDLAAKFTRIISLSTVCRNERTGELLSYSTNNGCQTGKKDPYTRLVQTKLEWEEAGEQKEIVAKLLVLNSKLP